jgi:hypothetical protein
MGNLPDNLWGIGTTLIKGSRGDRGRQLARMLVKLTGWLAGEEFTWGIKG